MNTSTRPEGDRPFVLVLGVDLADTVTSGFAFEQAARMVRRIPGSQLHVVYVVGAHATPDEAREALGLLELYVEEKASAIGDMAAQSTGVHVRSGEPGHEIAQIASDVRADVVVVGTHRTMTLRALVVGSTAERVMALATCPVLIAGPRPKPKPEHVIVIDPPCPDCVQARLDSRGAAWWCKRHSESHHLRQHHLYSYHRELSLRQHDSAVTPTGVD